MSAFLLWVIPCIDFEGKNRTQKFRVNLAVENFVRKYFIEKLRKKILLGQPIIGGGAGTGLSAKCEEDGGIDLIVIYNSGKYRMAGRGSLVGLLAYGNANDIVIEMASEVLPVVKKTPVLAGINATDPFIVLKPFLKGV